MKAIKIKMKAGCSRSNNLVEIDKIYISGCSEPGYYTKAYLHDYLNKNPNSIQVNIYPYPNLQPMLSSNKEKYVRSEPDKNGYDNLLCLPRE
ncbi:MAG: DUF3892 domain-containing protein [Oscillospiraceae bacterium]|nr:DUF3892 domain-containing protein [Oscillospiraceae bacterium]